MSFTNIQFDNDFDFSYVDFKDFDFPSLDDYTQQFLEPTMSLETEMGTSASERNPESVDESASNLDRKEIYESSFKLSSFSKKFSKPEKQFITKENGQRLAPFFKQWKVMKRNDKYLKNEIRCWYSSFNMSLNKTYIYREFFDSVRVHFRVAVVNHFDFKALDESDWRRLFINLTAFLMKEVNNAAGAIQRGKHSQVYPVWIEDINTFRIEKLPTL